MDIYHLLFETKMVVLFSINILLVKRWTSDVQKCHKMLAKKNVNGVSYYVFISFYTHNTSFPIISKIFFPAISYMMHFYINYTYP